MQKLSDKKIETPPGSSTGSPNVSGPLVPKKGLALFGFFTPRTETLGKNIVPVVKEPVPKSPHSYVPRADLPAVKNWIALEEKIVDGYKEQKPVQFKSTVPPLQTPVKQLLPGPSNLSRQEKKASSPLTVKKGFSFLGLFTPRTGTRGKSAVPVLKDSVLKSPHANVPRADLPAVKSWIALEEKIVDGYKEQKPVQFKSTVPPLQTPVKQPLPAVETFTARTAVSLPSSVSKLKDLPRGSKRTFSGVTGFLLACGWLAAGVFIFAHAQGVFSSREISRELTRLQDEKTRLEQSYAALKNASEDRSAEMEWLNGQLRDKVLKLKTAKAGKVAYEQGLEKKYREELMRITVRYESELSALRGAARTQTAVVNALKAQSQAFDRIVDQVGMSALSGAAAGFSQGPFSAGGTSALRGNVTSVNGRQGFVVINLGSEQGVRSGDSIAISRSGVGLAGGRVDRVYPTMSAALVRDAGMLPVIQAGDNVSFS